MNNPNAKILVVDDVAENRDLLLRRLTRLGFAHIDQAANGVEALAAIAAQNYDLVLLDIMMPVLDGFGVLEALRRDGRVAMHGLALTPGDTAAFGFAGERPVLLLPGRLDSALSVWLTLGRPALDRLAAAKPAVEFVDTVRLTRKIASAIGVTELVPVTRDGRGAEPLASRYLPLSAISRADGYVLVPAESEGYSAGSAVRVWPWP